MGDGGPGSGAGGTSTDVAGAFWYDATGKVPYDFLYLFVIYGETPGFKGDLVGKWAEGKGSTIHNVIGQADTNDLVQIDSTGESWLYAFDRGGKYGVLKMLSVKTGSCASSGAYVERGTYSFDGQSLKLTPDGYESTASVCGGPAETKHKDTPPRTYTVTSAVYQEFGSPNNGVFNSGIHLVGPCADYETSTTDHCELKLQRIDDKPTGIASPRSIGQTCDDANPCIAPYACDTSSPDGYCTASCRSIDDCPSAADGDCIHGLCIRWCIKGDASKQCRDGYACTDYGDPYLGACVPAAT